MRKLHEQGKRRFRLPDSRSALLLLALVGIISAGLWLFSSTGSAELVYLTSKPLSSSQLSKATALLDQAGHAYRVRGSYILVESTHKDDLLKSLDLPCNSSEPQVPAYESTTSASSIFLSETERQCRWKLRRERDLASQISDFKSIRAAKVSLAGSSQPRFGSDPTPSTATVTVWTKDDQPVNLELAQAICQTVAGAVADVQPPNVKVIDANNGQSLPQITASSTQASALQRKAKTLEAQWEQKISTKLSYIRRLIVSVHINPHSLFNPTDSAGIGIPPVLTIKSEPDISVSLSVPRSHLVNLYRQWNHQSAVVTDLDLQPIAAEQIAKISVLARAIIGQPTSSYIHVDWYHDNPPAAQASAATATPAAAIDSPSSFAAWLSLPLCIAVLAIVALVVSVVVLSRKVSNSNSRQRAIALARLTAEKHYLNYSPIAKPSAQPIVYAEPPIYRGPAGLEVSAFEELLHLDDATLRGLLRRSDEQIIALALRTAPDKLRHRILAGLSHQRRQSVHDHQDFLAPVRLSDIEAAQQELVDLLEIPDHSSPELAGAAN